MVELQELYNGRCKVSTARSRVLSTTNATDSFA